MAGNAIAGMLWVGYICVRGQWFVGLEVHMCKGRYGALVLAGSAYVLCCVGSGMYVYRDDVGLRCLVSGMHMYGSDQGAVAGINTYQGSMGPYMRGWGCVHTGGCDGIVGLGMCVWGMWGCSV